MCLVIVMQGRYDPTFSFAADDNPFEQAAEQSYAGRFIGPDVSLRLKPEAGKWSGTILFKGKNYSVQGENKDGTLEGTGGEGDQAWSFTAKSDGDNLTFTAGTFTTKLKRLKLPKLEGVYASKRVKLEFQNKDGGTNGTIVYGGSQFQFGAAENAGDLEGVFKNGDKTFQFTLANESEGMTFRTGKFLDVVRPTPGRMLATQFGMQDRWTNSLGMVLLKVPGIEVLFSIWDTRVQDYKVYAENNEGVDGSWRNVQWQGVRVSDGPTHPVTMVSWNDAKAFCKWLTEQEQGHGILSANQSYRLPTDGEWDVAVGLEGEIHSVLSEKTRMIKGVYPWGTEWPPPARAGNYADRTAKSRFPDWTIIDGYDDGFATTSPVGSFKANHHGIYDMGGNVWQWLESWSNGDQKAHLLRGASWGIGYPDGLLSSNRSSTTAEVRSDLIGFRVVLECQTP